jgi:hypothetical protein
VYTPSIPGLHIACVDLSEGQVQDSQRPGHVDGAVWPGPAAREQRAVATPDDSQCNSAMASITLHKAHTQI